MFSTLYLKLFKLVLNRILNARAELTKNIFNNLFLEACEMFPDDKLSENRDLASATVKEILGLSNNLALNEDSKLINFKKKIINEEWLQKKVADYYRITAYYFNYGNLSSDSHLIAAEEYIKKATSITNDAKMPDMNEILSIKRELRKQNKKLRKSINLSQKEKIEREKLELIPPIKITSTHFSVALSLISTLFFISGFVYTKIFFYWFGVNVGDFYTVQDYVSSSIDVITTTALSAFMGLLSICYGVMYGWNEIIHDEQFEIKRAKRRSFSWEILVILCLITIAFSIYKTGDFIDELIIPPTLSTASFIFRKIPVWKHIDNKIQVIAPCFVIAFFFLHLGIVINEKVKDVKSKDYVPAYNLELKSEYSEYNGMKFLTSNSNYVFLIDNVENKVKILPKSSVTAFDVNNY
ncbi:conserved membrane hypothetical protein [Vibrio owensii]|nr:conserved membrane hypothetical protein [Vibrio owensii]CAH1579394.1 conserved membrane hypothetical protein [Vibrio owensii]